MFKTNKLKKNKIKNFFLLNSIFFLKIILRKINKNNNTGAKPNLNWGTVISHKNMLKAQSIKNIYF
jgi:hypothetical protein